MDNQSGILSVNNQSGIYEIVNTVNGKRYIGSAVKLGARWNKHRRELQKRIHHNAPLQHAWNKYGESVFKFLPILTCQKSMLRFYEQQLLDKVKPEYNVATNATQPMAGRRHTEATKMKMSQAGVGRKHTPEHCAAMSRARVGKKMKPHTAETKARQSAALKGKTKSKEHRAALSAANAGKKLSCETIEKLRISNTGRTLSQAARAKISESKLGKKRAPFSEAAKENMSAARKREAAARKARGAAGSTKGRVQSVEERAHKSLVLKAYWATKKAAQ